MAATSPASPSSVQARSLPSTIPPHLQSTSTLQALLEPITLSRRSTKSRITNWGGTFTYKPPKVFAPTTVTQCAAILELARRMGKQVRAVGRAHSPSDLMMSEDWAIRTEGLSGTLEIDATGPSATFLAGTLISDINQLLADHQPPMAMVSLGSISEQTIGGLIATATHGSGYDFPSVSSRCLELETLVPLPADKGGVQLLKCSRNENADLFNATLCGLGCTGFVTSVKLTIEPAFRLRHLVEEVEFSYIFGKKTGYPAIEAVNETGDQEESSSRMSVAEFTSASTLGLPEKSVAHQGPPRKTLQSVGKLLAAGKPLPPPRARYMPDVRQNSAADIWPCSSTETEATARDAPGWVDDEDDDETRAAQARVDAIVQSSQHTRLWLFPHVDMATLSRADRTLEAAVGPSLGQRMYHTVVGFHLTQFLLFVARYHRALPGVVARTVHYLTHPSFPVEHRGKPALDTNGDSQQQSEDAARAAESSAPGWSSDYESFTSTSPLTTIASSSSSTLRPLQPHHPSSLTVDHSYNVFNMDCLFPQYTSEWAIPYTHTAACLRAMRDWLQEEQLSSNGEQIHFPIEVRWTDADGIWTSHGYGRKNCYIGLIQFRPYNLPTRYRALFSKFENLMRHFAGRPHWAKTHTCGPLELHKLYPHLGDFLATREKFDPEGVMMNAYTKRHLLGTIGEEVGVRRFKKRERGKL